MAQLSAAWFSEGEEMDGDERIVRTKAAAAEELCGAINEARAEVVAGQG
jgi:hypothetical protein